MHSKTSISIVPYREELKAQVIDLILHIQNVEAGVGISAQEQPDILAIQSSYLDQGGGFWVALDESGQVAGTIGLQREDAITAVLKKFFVRADHRGTPEGPAIRLYAELLAFASGAGIRTIVLDTPAVATRSHAFYERAGFRKIDKADLPVAYDYPDRGSLLFRLDLP
ncbi:GNAT family N-acetyltransferase [Pseudoduganella lutea]|uniref:GNAT family N-acetyltransferase n=1 Tax=Pseudoduganella lutea TaxID=321985 RepID=A0A4P6KRY5_9BURK|nr:GNAT family N-acetyltransferase [Pseudoduganella lutea]QBE61861.1 GNAT family N-acetyltransferase [Pseudoduganella lutea]